MAFKFTRARKICSVFSCLWWTWRVTYTAILQCVCTKTPLHLMTGAEAGRWNRPRRNLAETPPCGFEQHTLFVVPCPGGLWAGYLCIVDSLYYTGRAAMLLVPVSIADNALLPSNGMNSPGAVNAKRHQMRMDQRNIHVKEYTSTKTRWGCQYTLSNQCTDCLCNFETDQPRFRQSARKDAHALVPDYWWRWYVYLRLWVNISLDTKRA